MMMMLLLSVLLTSHCTWLVHCPAAADVVTTGTGDHHVVRAASVRLVVVIIAVSAVHQQGRAWVTAPKATGSTSHIYNTSHIYMCDVLLAQHIRAAERAMHIYVLRLTHICVPPCAMVRYPVWHGPLP